MTHSPAEMLSVQNKVMKTKCLYFFPLIRWAFSKLKKFSSSVSYRLCQTKKAMQHVSNKMQGYRRDQEKEFTFPFISH